MRLTRLAALLCWGAASLSSQAPPAAAKPPASQAKVVPALSDEAKVARLRELVEQGEKALDAEDEEAASERSEEAEVLVADWAPDLLGRPDVMILLERLRGVQSQVQEEGSLDGPSASAEETGLKEPTEVVTLSATELRSESELVRAAAQGATYDFPIDLNDKVLTWVRLFTTEKRGYMERTLSRASAYMPMIRQVFAEEGIPQDLAYLGVVESGYINSAKSYAKAVGMWQFMRSTGRIFGLEGTRWVEERRDPVKATRAAARYLRRLYELSGDWYLALVGYNAGPLTAERAARQLETRNFWDMYRSPYLRNQTKNYVPELCAAILVGRNPDRYGLKIDQNPPFIFETVQVGSMTSLRVLARSAGVDEDTLKVLNPELIRGSTPPGSYTFRVPVGKGLETQRRLAGVSPEQRTDFKGYKLRRGDTLERVAKRFHVDPEDLLETNHLSRAQFKPGRRIQIPPPSMVHSGDENPTGLPVMDEHPLESLPSIPAPGASATPPPSAPQPSGSPSPATQLSVPTPAAPEPLKPEPAGPTYIAKAGDTLAKIARAKGLSLGELVRLNPEGARKLGVGDEVRLPAGRTAAAPTTHVVKRGETLASIAERFGVGVQELKRWNHLRSGRVRAGQRLKLAPR
ncbi:MAG TPA: LysM peptidoglycan-binding domain-containing protein [Holophagaceae bacterium]|nr:LysM peptidoglycan-binding domain-containing protein [Holophagaceae bacterium]